MASPSPIIRAADGSTHWICYPGDTYAATGITCDGKRFRITNPNWSHIRGINLWRGSKWLIRDGRRHRICTVFN